MDAPPAITSEFRKRLQEFRDVFPDELPKMLPPERQIGDTHSIELVEGAKPFAKSPYKTSP